MDLPEGEKFEYICGRFYTIYNRQTSMQTDRHAPWHMPRYA